MNGNYNPITEQYSTEDTSLDDILGLRKKTLQRKLLLLDEQVLQRRSNLRENLYEISIDLCACGTAAMQIPDSDVTSHQRILLKYKMPLYREIRQQRNDYLRDIAMLQREQLDTKIQYLSFIDKQHLLQ